MATVVDSGCGVIVVVSVVAVVFAFAVGGSDGGSSGWVILMVRNLQDCCGCCLLLHAARAEHTFRKPDVCDLCSVRRFLFFGGPKLDVSMFIRHFAAGIAAILKWSSLICFLLSCFRCLAHCMPNFVNRDRSNCE